MLRILNNTGHQNQSNNHMLPQTFLTTFHYSNNLNSLQVKKITQHNITVLNLFK